MKKNEYLSGRGDDIRILGLSSSLYNTLKKDNINTVGELIMECNHNHFVDNISKSDIKEIRRCIHTYGLVLSDEEPTILKKEIDITKEKVSYLDLSLRLRLLLRLNGIKSIGDLVNSDYETLSKLGSKNLKILRDLIHGEGCLFIDDEPYILDMRNYNLEDMLDMINSDSKVSLGETKETELNRYKQVNKEIKLDIKDGLETIRGMYGVIGENECLNEMKKVVDDRVNKLDSNIKVLKR